jgi:hypothetical protein
MEPSPATTREIEERRRSLLRFWVTLGVVSALFIPVVWVGAAAAGEAVVVVLLMAAFSASLIVYGYLQFCRVNLLTIYERGLAPPFKPKLSWSRAMDFRVPFEGFTRIEVEDNDIDRKEMAEQIDFRFVFHYPDGRRLVLGPSILGRSPSKEQQNVFYAGLKEAIGKAVPDRVELRKVFPDGKRPVAAVSSQSIRLRVGAQLREFPWKGIEKLRIRPAKLGGGGSFEAFDVLTQSGWTNLEAGRIPALRKPDLLTFIEEILRIARARKVEILQE